MYVYTNAYKSSIAINEKRSHEYEKEQDEYMGMFGGRKWGNCN